jgi:hypothetical protein
MPTREPRVVAELGRPETPEEAATRKAANSRAYRDSKTVRNLLVALGVSLLLVLGIAAIVVRPDPGPPEAVDWHAVAAQAGPAYADPALPAGWTSNAAELRTDGDTRFWYLGFVTPDDGFVALEQRPTRDAGWVEQHGDRRQLSAPASVTAGATWATYTHDGEPTGNYARVWESSGTGEQFLLYGTASEADFRTLATAIEGWTR